MANNATVASASKSFGNDVNLRGKESYICNELKLVSQKWIQILWNDDQLQLSQLSSFIISCNGLRLRPLMIIEAHQRIKTTETTAA